MLPPMPMVEGTQAPPGGPREPARLTAMLAGGGGAVKDAADQNLAHQHLAAVNGRPSRATQGRRCGASAGR